MSPSVSPTPTHPSNMRDIDEGGSKVDSGIEVRTFHILGASVTLKCGITPNCRSVFRAGVSLNIHSFIRFVVKAFAHGSMGSRIDPSWAGPILIPASAPRLV